MGKSLYFATVVTVSSFFLAHSQLSEIGCLPYFHTWCGLSTNLECISEMCCTQLAENTGCQNYTKKSPSVHHGTSVGLYISTCPHNMMNFSPLTAEISWWVWGTPANFNGFPSWLHYCTDVSQWRPTKLCTMFGWLLGWYTMYTFWGPLSPNRILPGANSVCIQVLRSPILAALMHGTRAVVVSQTLRHGTKNGIRELLLLVTFNRGRHLYSQGGHHIGHRPRFQFRTVLIRLVVVFAVIIKCLLLLTF